jgi:DNA-binding transcriptional ArsR family regulator
MFNHMVDHLQPELDLVFSAVADPIRRAILGTIATKPATVTEIARPFPVSLNAISKHLMVLERAGLIQREIIGREHYCALQAQPLRQANAWLEHYRRFWELRLDKLEEFLIRKQRAAKENKSHAVTGTSHTQTGDSSQNARPSRSRVRRVDRSQQHVRMDVSGRRPKRRS